MTYCISRVSLNLIVSGIRIVTDLKLLWANNEQNRREDKICLGLKKGNIKTQMVLV